MATNLPEAWSPPTAAGRFWQRRTALNPLKSVFSVRIRPLDLGAWMLSKKLSLDVGVEMLAGENRSLAAKIRVICCSFRSYHFFLPLRRSVRSTPTFKSFFVLKTMFLLLPRPSKFFIFFHSTVSYEWWFGGKPSQRRQQVRPSLLLHLYNRK